jgi:hypothetical protein
VNGLSRPGTAKGDLQRTVLALLHEHERNGELPTNARFVFYELEQRAIVSKVRRGARRSDQNTTDALMHLRNAALVPWSWIVDETRWVGGYDRKGTIREEVAAFIEEATINPWAGKPPLVLVESRSLGGVLRSLVEDEYRCRLAPTNGQAGGFLRTDVAPLLAGNDRQVLYLGDLDVSGAQIEENTRRVLEREAGREITWPRVTITTEQVAERGLEPIVKYDRRYRPAREHEAWETEALGQRTVLALLREALDDLLPEPLADVLERERVEREAERRR